MNCKRFSIISLLLVASIPLFSQNTNDPIQQAFYFGGQRIYVGLSQIKATMALSSCCELSPKEIKPIPIPGKGAPGQFILSKDHNEILGSIWFSEGKVSRVSRDLAVNVDSYSQDLVSFMKILKRSLPEGTNEAVVTIKHKSMSNGDSDEITIVFPDGHGIELEIVTLDTPFPGNGDRREAVNLTEFLVPHM